MHIYLKKQLKMRYVPLQSLFENFTVTYFQLLSSQTAATSDVIKKAFRDRVSPSQAKAMSLKGDKSLVLSITDPVLTCKHLLHGNTDYEQPADTCVPPHVLMGTINTCGHYSMHITSL